MICPNCRLGVSINLAVWSFGQFPCPACQAPLRRELRPGWLLAIFLVAVASLVVCVGIAVPDPGAGIGPALAVSGSFTLLAHYRGSVLQTVAAPRPIAPVDKLWMGAVVTIAVVMLALFAVWAIKLFLAD